MDDTQNKAISALAGGAIGALNWMNRLQRDDERRLDRIRSSATDANSKIESWLGSADYVRLLIGTVRDVLGGVAYATQPQIPPKTIPDLGSSLNRPNISQDSGSQSYTWPPKTGEYDDIGRNKTTGELAILGLALTYQEVRAALVGMTQPTPPTDAQKLQIHRVYNALTCVAEELNLSLDQYKTVFRALFTSGVANTAVLDSHQDPGRSPTAASLVVGLTIAPLLPAPQAPGQIANRNTDNVQHWRITSSAGVNAGSPLAAVSFGTEYRYRLPDGTTTPFTPAVAEVSNVNSLPVGNWSRFAPYLITSQGFQIINLDQLVAGTYDIHIPVIAGQAAVSVPS